MHQPKYLLLVSGKPLPGMTPAQVAGNLIRGLKFSQDQVKQILGGKPRIIKSTADLVALKKLREKLVAAGVNCQIKQSTDDDSAQTSAVIKTQTTRPVAETSDKSLPSKIAAETTSSSAKTELSFELKSFIPKLYSSSAQQVIRDSSAKTRFELRRDGNYIGWLLLIPCFALISAALVFALANYMKNIIDSKLIISLVSAFEFVVIWIFGVLYARPVSTIDIVDINRSNEVFVLQQTANRFFRHKEFYLATDLPSQNASIYYDQFTDHCICESIDGLVLYQTDLQQSKPAFSGFFSLIFNYLKAIPAGLIAPQGKSYKVLDHENRLLGTYTIGKDAQIRSHRADTNIVYLLSMALVSAGA